MIYKTQYSEGIKSNKPFDLIVICNNKKIIFKNMISCEVTGRYDGLDLIAEKVIVED